MPLYTMQVTVKVFAESPNEAYRFIQHATDNAKKADIELIDTEVIETELDEDDEPRRKLTRTERQQGMADRGCDTLDEARGNR